MNDQSKWCICGHHINSHVGTTGCEEDDATDRYLPCDCTGFDPLWDDGGEAW